MALVTPIVNNIPAFDATETTPITFTADGGSEIFKNEIKIVNNATDVIVYTNTITTHALGQSIPANTLVNGTYYKVAFRTYDAYDNVSEWSNYQPFYCYSTPTLSFNISDGDTLNTTSFDLKLTYNQAEDERLESAVIYFYDSADNLISTSGNLFNNNYPPIIFKYTLRSFENNKTYRVKADATTINGTSLTTGIISFSVSYQTVDNEGELYLTMDSCNGYINVRSAPVIDAVQGENRHNPAVLSYISDEMVDLTSVMGEIDTTNNYSSWIEWYDFSPVTNAFLFRLWFYPARVSFKIAEIISTDGDSRVTMTFRRGGTQDYIVITSTDGTRIAKELGTICNGNTKVFLWVKVVGNTWDVQTEILSNIETILDWNNTDNNISYNVTSDINYGNESYGDFIPRRNIYHALSGSYDKVIVGNGIFDALDLSININRPYSSEIPQHDISAVLFISFNGSIINHAPTGYTRAMLQRKDSSMITWFDLTETEIDTSISTELQYNDYLIPNGITQTYSLILYQGDTPSDAYTIDIVPKWGRVFLSDKDESYNLNYSVIYSNGSQNIQNGILMPISATYPIVIQNAEGNYRSGSLQFKVLGYQFEIDKTLDRNSIVKQTNDILAFLTNGKVKCIKDYNGNIFICKVVNSPQISYDANWGNGIATISFDWVEQAKYNKYDEMVEANIIDNTIVPPTPEPVPTPTTPIEPFIERVYLPNGNSPDTIYPSQGIYAYTMYYGDNGTSSNTVNLYMPTNEYEIVSYKINNASQTIPQIQESGDELYYVLNFRTDSSSTDDSAVIVTVRDNNNNEISYTFNFVCTAESIYITTSKYYVNSASSDLIIRQTEYDGDYLDIKFNQKHNGEAYRTSICVYDEWGSSEDIGFLYVSDNIESIKLMLTITSCEDGDIQTTIVDLDDLGQEYYTCEFRGRTWYVVGDNLFSGVNYRNPNMTFTPSDLKFIPHNTELYDWSYFGLDFLQCIYGESPFVPIPSIIPSFNTATDQEIANIISAYYDGQLSLEDIQSVWSVGDVRTISLSAMEATGVGESHAAQNVDIAILGFNHDDLTTSINGKTKALITVQLLYCLGDYTVEVPTNDECGYINNVDTNIGGWKNSKRRAWCNGVFYPALPTYIKDLVKPVDKPVTTGNKSSSLENPPLSEYAWLLSNYEVFGSNGYAVAKEGNQYEFYMTASRRKKTPKYYTWGRFWWLRSPSRGVTTNFCYVDNNGSAGYYPATGTTSQYPNPFQCFAPAWCM